MDPSISKKNLPPKKTNLPIYHRPQLSRKKKKKKKKK